MAFVLADLFDRFTWCSIVDFLSPPPSAGVPQARHNRRFFDSRWLLIHSTRIYCPAGFSDKTMETLKFLDADQSALLREIEAVEL